MQTGSEIVVGSMEVACISDKYMVSVQKKCSLDMTLLRTRDDEE